MTYEEDYRCHVTTYILKAFFKSKFTEEDLKNNLEEIQEWAIQIWPKMLEKFD